MHLAFLKTTACNKEIRALYTKCLWIILTTEIVWLLYKQDSKIIISETQKKHCVFTASPKITICYILSYPFKNLQDSLEYKSVMFHFTLSRSPVEKKTDRSSKD